MLSVEKPEGVDAADQQVEVAVADLEEPVTAPDPVKEPDAGATS